MIEESRPVSAPATHVFTPASRDEANLQLHNITTRPQPPSIVLGSLFSAVQRAKLFPDQKTFPDAIPNKPARDKRAEYDAAPAITRSQLQAFIDRDFTPQQRNEVTLEKRDRTAREYIRDVSALLTRQPDDYEEGSSLIGLPKPYLVPGGRFSKICYWDSFFSMKGMQSNGDHVQARHMVKNLAHLIDTVGHVPNGNRSYYTSRSQPPVFACMVELLAQQEGAHAYAEFLPHMQQEHDYFMAGSEALEPGQASLHAVRTADGSLLNRYYDELDTERDESFEDDLGDGDKRSKRAAAESGWDFSSRWLEDGKTMSSIRTTAMLPIDLNCLMVKMERTLATAYRQIGEMPQATLMDRRADIRAKAINTLMWHPTEGIYTDYLWKEDAPAEQLTAATAFPLFVDIADQDQANQLADVIQTRLLVPGGLATTLIESGQQWDKPNGWAPLQMIAAEGLRAYGHEKLAREIAWRWTDTVEKGLKKTGVMLEKYNVDDPDCIGGHGGEYPLQVGFGWTMGVHTMLTEAFGTRPASKPQPAIDASGIAFDQHPALSDAIRSLAETLDHRPLAALGQV